MTAKPTCPTCGSGDPKWRKVVDFYPPAPLGFVSATPTYCHHHFHDATPALEPNPGQTHYVGDRCAGGHQPEPERTGETGDFEIHVTVRGERPNEVADWALSSIEGDPDGRFIFTRHMPTLALAKASMNGLTNGLRFHGHNVAREKIEHVVHDRRFKEPR